MPLIRSEHFSTYKYQSRQSLKVNNKWVNITSPSVVKTNAHVSIHVCISSIPVVFKMFCNGNRNTHTENISYSTLIQTKSFYFRITTNSLFSLFLISWKNPNHKHIMASLLTIVVFFNFCSKSSS